MPHDGRLPDAKGSSGVAEPYAGGRGPYVVLFLDGRPVAHPAPHGGRVTWLPED